MKNMILVLGLVMSGSVFGATNDPLNCVNPGGGCDGSVPCCNASVNACVRGRCVPVPRFTDILMEAAALTDCGTVQCYDTCSHSYQTYRGNTCDSAYSTSKHCYESYAYCKGSHGGDPCAGKTVSCYDICTHSYQSYRGNKCESSYSTSKHCYESYGSCS